LILPKLYRQQRSNLEESNSGTTFQRDLSHQLCYTGGQPEYLIARCKKIWDLLLIPTYIMQPEHSSPGTPNLPTGQPPLTMERLHAMINQLHTQLVATQGELSTTQSQLLTAQQQATQGGGSGGPKRNKPPTFDGKGSVDSWLQHMNEYCAGVSESERLAIAITYLSSSAHEWYIGTKILENSPVHDYAGF
jgi:hypothetical protein